MVTALSTLPSGAEGPFMRPGVVVARSDGGIFRVRVAFGDRRFEVGARLADSGGRPPRQGEAVLVAGESLDDCYILGRVDAQEAAPTRIEASGGASAEVIRGDAQECIQVRDADANLIFEYDASSGRTVLAMPAGDLEIRTPKGNIDLVAGRGLRCRAGDEIALGAGPVSGLGWEVPGLRIGPQSTDLNAKKLQVAARRGEFAIADLAYAGEQLSAKLQRAKVVLDRLETVARHAVARVRDLYQFIEGLSQSKAGRMRTLVDGAYHLKGESVSVKAEGTMKIDGERINLG